MAAPSKTTVQSLYREIFYGFRLTKGHPIDERFQVESLASLATSMPEHIRYSGIFFSKLENNFYCFDNDLTTPIPLTEKIFSSIATGITLIESDYPNILSFLTSLTPKIGNVCLVAPIGVSFQFDGIGWNYFAGEYTFADLSLWNALPSEFKKVNAVVHIGDVNYIIDSQKLLSESIIIIESFDDIITAIEDNRYYLVDGFLYYRIGGIMFQLGSKTKLFKNLTLTPSIEIEHNFNTTYIRALFQLYSLNPLINNNLINIELKAINTTKVQVINDLTVTGDLILTANI